MRRAGLVGLACAGAALGVVAEQQEYAWQDLSGWLPDLFAGWTLIGSGIALLALRRPLGAGALLLLSGITWFAFNFESSGSATVEWLALHAAYLHRAPLLQLALAQPAGTARTRLAIGGVVGGWIAAILWPLWDEDITAFLLAAGFVAVSVTSRARARGRRSRTIAGRSLAAVSILCAAIALDALRSIGASPDGFESVTVPLYAVGVAVAGLLLFSAVLLQNPASLTERAVELERRGVTLRDGLRDLLGDPQLDLGFAEGPGAFVDDDGRPLAVGAGRLMSPVEVGGHQVAIVVHEATTLADAATRSAVLAAVGLAAERTRLRAEVERQIEAVRASRRRLLLAEDDERLRLAERIDRGPGTALEEVEVLVRKVRQAAGGHEALATALDRAADQLAGVRPELDALVRGLGRVDANGLAPALEQLAAGLPFDVQLELRPLSVPTEVGSVLFFVCSESLANVVKHADARSVRIALDLDGANVRLSIEDDGRGGADSTGSGLVGLADRVAALGGRLLVVSPRGSGTRIVAELPLVDGTGVASPFAAAVSTEPIRSSRHVPPTME